MNNAQNATPKSEPKNVTKNYTRLIIQDVHNPNMEIYESLKLVLGASSGCTFKIVILFTNEVGGPFAFLKRGLLL